jgi:hypothetical protein
MTDEEKRLITKHVHELRRFQQVAVMRLESLAESDSLSAARVALANWVINSLLSGAYLNEPKRIIEPEQLGRYGMVNTWKPGDPMVITNSISDAIAAIPPTYAKYCWIYDLATGEVVCTEEYA